MKIRLIVLLLTIIIASYGTAKQDVPRLIIRGAKYKAPKKYKNSTFTCITDK